jgi:hypothetical protein
VIANSVLLGLQEASALEQPYEASTQRLLNPLKVLFGDSLNAMEFHPLGLGTEQAIGHTTVKVDMRLQFR